MKDKFLPRDGALEADAAVAAADGESSVMRRRALLTGGAALAGAVGVGTIVSGGPANAATGDPVLQGMVNTMTANSAATEIDATSSTAPTPTMILTNKGSTGTETINGTTYAYASPTLRLTPAGTDSAGHAQALPDPNAAAGDLTHTNDGNLWFQHYTVSGPAAVHTDATANSYWPLTAPVRMVDTRLSAPTSSSYGRAFILDPSGNLNSKGQLIGGKTIHIDLSGLVIYGLAVMANLTVLPAAGGWILTWPGAGTRPVASSIDFASGVTLANLTVTGLSEYTAGSTTSTDTIAITASATTHVLFDVGGFYVGNPGQINPNYLTAAATPGSSVSAGRQAKANIALHAAGAAGLWTKN